jgi:hypothetical protein
VRRNRRIRTGFVVLMALGATLALGACGSTSPGVANLGSSSSTTVAGGAFGNSGGPPTPQQLTAMTKWAACVRRHGAPNFPDPPYQNGELNKLGYTKSSPQMIKANKECHALALAAGAVLSKGELEKYIQQDLKISDCMHVHGFVNFPDPNSQGQMSQSVSSAQRMVNSPGYAKAAKVCGAPPGG